MNKDKNEPPGFRECQDWADNCCCRCKHFQSYRDMYDDELEDNDSGCCYCLCEFSQSPPFKDQSFYGASHYNTCDKFEKEEQ